MSIFFRYENSSNASPGHASHVRKRSSPLLFCILHLRHRGGATVARDVASKVLSPTASKFRLPEVSSQFDIHYYIYCLFMDMFKFCLL